MRLPTSSIRWRTDSTVDLEDGSKVTLERGRSGLLCSHSFGPPDRDWLTLSSAERPFFEGVLVDMADAGWVGLMVEEPAQLIVMDVRERLTVRMRLPLWRESSGDRPLRTLDFYGADGFVVAEVETALIVLDRAGWFRYAIPHRWPQTLIHRAQEGRLSVHGEQGSCEFDLEIGPTIWR